jgi:Ca-activated chloride channel family protein
MTLAIHTDRALIRVDHKSTRYILARITAPRAERRDSRLPVNIAIVLDRSGSMGDERKFAIAADAVKQSLRMLSPTDRFSLVVYDTEIDVLMPSSLASADAVRRALSALAEVGPRGGTDLGAGWLKGCDQIAAQLEAERVNRCLLLTDGLANQGIKDRGALARFAGEQRQRGIVTTTFGVGADFDERLLRGMAHEGGGNFYFIEGAAQIPGILTSELGEALEITLRSASLVVTSNVDEQVTALNDFRQAVILSEAKDLLGHSREAKDLVSMHIELGDLTSGQELDVVLRMDFPLGAPGETASAEFELRSAGHAVAGGAGGALWTYAYDAENDAQPRNVEVDRAVAKIFAARARAEATEANREGRYDRARRIVEETARRIRGYAGNDPELRRLAQDVLETVREYVAPMSMMEMKASYYAASAPLKGRHRSGRARKG